MSTQAIVVPTLDIELANIKLAIFWKSLGELDIYTTNKVKTVNGSHAELIANILRTNSITVETME